MARTKAETPPSWLHLGSMSGVWHPFLPKHATAFQPSDPYYYIACKHTHPDLRSMQHI